MPHVFNAGFTKTAKVYEDKVANCAVLLLLIRAALLTHHSIQTKEAELQFDTMSDYNYGWCSAYGGRWT